MLTPRGMVATGKVVEEGGRRIFERVVDSGRHRLRTGNAYATDVSVLEQLREQGVGWLRNVESDTGRVLEIPLAHFIAKGFRVDRGYGAQVACPVKWWTVVQGSQLGLPLAPVEDAALEVSA